MSPVFWARLWRACTCLLVACCVVLAERRDEAVGDSDASEPNSHPAHHYLNQWAVEVQGGEEGARRVARETGFTYLSKVGTLDDFHTFAHPHHPEVHHEHAHEKTSVLHGHTEVRWAEQQKVLKRSKRSIASQEHAPRHPHHRHHQQHPSRRRRGLPKRDVPLSVNATGHGQPYHDPRDPMWSQMWYHFRRYQEPMPVWRRGYTGRGVVISILDDGIEYTHPDLKNQYDPEASYDYNDNDPDPKPRPSYENKHGTRCAGEASAGLNDVCVVGAAYNSSIGGVRMLDGTVTDIVEGHSLSFHPQHIDIYSSSWGPDDDGLTVDGPARLAQAAFKQGTEKGRGGLGSIFVWASGNGGSKGDSCGCDGYTNTIYSISVSAMSEHGASPWYSEHCSSTLASTYSSGKKSQGERKIVTVDLNDGCTSAHTGTSAAAPMAAGLLALVLEANPKLTWRDVQHIVVLTSQPHPPDAVNYQPNIWTRNAAGHTHSHEFGFGLMHTAAMVNLARHWRRVPDMRSCLEHTTNIDQTKPGTFTIEARACQGTANEVRYAENVIAIISVGGSRRGGLKFGLTSPQGTYSELLPYRRKDFHTTGFDNWRFLTVRSWGENPHGQWKFTVDAQANVRVTSIQLEIHGTYDAPAFTRLPEMSDCHTQCHDGCVGLSSKDCHSCKEMTVFLDDNAFDCVPYDSCPPGFYKQEITCRKCAVKNCWECGSDGHGCKSCSPGYSVHGGRCVVQVQCTNGQIYSEEAGSCVACGPRCERCASPSQCAVCLTGSKLWQDQCWVSCPTPASVQEGHDLCVACNDDCNGCGPTNDICTACKSPKVLWTNGTCFTQCPSGSVAVEGVCKLCPVSCLQCRADMTCTLCKPSTLILPGSSGSGCVTSCPPGFRADTSGSSHRCEPCNAELLCAACTESAGACSACDGGRVLLASGQCADQCPDGYAVDGLGKTCQRCSVPGCVDCTNDAQSCAMCSEDMLRLTVAGSVSCVASCPAGYFRSEGARECQPCASECKSCTTAADSCSSCQPPLLLHGGVCLRECPQETFAQSQGGVCVACDPSCALCRGPGANDCARCSESGYKVDMLYGCVSSTCRPGQYANATHCIPCSTVCAECNASAEQCTACPTGKSLMHAQCLDACPSGFVEDSRGMCVECKRNCAACAPGKVRLAGECVQGCPAHGYARVNSVCVKCVDASCRSCPRSADQCLDCQLPNRYLLEGRCVATCPPGQFAHGRNICSTCHSSCAACVSDSPDSCTACHRPSVLQSGSCVSTCDDGFFPQAAVVGGVKLGAMCTACNARCLHCESAGVCTTCKTGFALAAGSKTCVSECSAGEVLDVSAQRCIACPPGCSTCSQSGKCTRCQGQRWLHHGQCLLECPPRFYPESATGARCRKCHAGCATCSGPSVCRTCIAGLFRHADGLCRAECPSGEYIHRDGGACHKCNSLCLTCAGPGESDCVQCKAVLPNGWYSRQDGSCGRCHASCKACAGTATPCISCRASQKLVNGACLEVPTSCRPSHYLDKKIGRCLPCADNCEQCSNDGGAVVCDRCAVTHRKSPVDGRCYPCCTVLATSTTPPCCACSPDDSALTCSPGSFSTAPSSTSESSTHGSSQVVEVVHRNRQGVQPTARPDDEDVRMRAKRPGGVGGGTDQAHTSRNVAARAVAVVVAGIVAFLAVIYFVMLVYRRLGTGWTPSVQYKRLAVADEAADDEEVDL